MPSRFCALLRTKTAYYRTPDGERIFKPDDSAACYTCLKTQRPVGPDGQPVDAQSCGPNHGSVRGCFQQE